MTGIGNKFNENIQLFSQEQVSKIYKELNIDPPKSNSKPVKQPQPDQTQSVEDILKSNFIEEES